MQPQTTLPRETGAEPVPVPGGGRRRMVFWVATVAIVFELVAGSLWNLFAIDWNEAQLRHLGYPDYFVYILGVAHVGAAAAIIVPGLPRLKEWAYAGSFFMWSGAVVSHLTLGDGPSSWGPPLMFAVLAIVSWALRPADRRDLSAGRVAGNIRARAWTKPIAILVVMYAVAFATLPAVDDFMRERAVELGWLVE